MVWKDFFFVMNYLSTMHTSVDDLEFFLQVTKSLDHLRGEGGRQRTHSVEHMVHQMHITVCTLHRVRKVKEVDDSSLYT